MGQPQGVVVMVELRQRRLPYCRVVMKQYVDGGNNVSRCKSDVDRRWEGAGASYTLVGRTSEEQAWGVEKREGTGLTLTKLA